MLYGVTDRSYFPGLDACFSFTGVSSGRDKGQMNMMSLTRTKTTCEQSSALTGCSFVWSCVCRRGALASGEELRLTYQLAVLFDMWHFHDGYSLDYGLVGYANFYLLICLLYDTFNRFVSNSIYVPSNGRMVVSKELKRMWVEEVRHLPWRTEENHETLGKVPI
jgi:hypothetical protein